MDKWVDPIKDQVAWDYGYINWNGFTEALKRGDSNAWVEFDVVTSKVAREYGEEIESYYDDDIDGEW